MSAATLLAKLLHWLCAATTVPFAVSAFIFPNPERVKFAAERVALPLPRWLLGFCSSFVHLTVVSHELTAWYFVLALARDHGLTAAPREGGSDWLEVYYAVACALAIFIATVFWAAVIVDPALMCHVDEMFGERLKPLEVKKWLFRGMFGPPETKHQYQGPFLAFMRYIHTLCPLLLVLEAACVRHRPEPLGVEMGAALAVVAGYVAWNLFCWWLLRQSPYPLQKRIWHLGIVPCVAAYAALVGYALLLLGYSRYMRGTEGQESVAAVLAPAAVVLWGTSGLAPFKGAVARLQGLDPTELLVAVRA